MGTIWRVFAYLSAIRWLAAGTLACAIVGTLMVIVFPAVTKWIIDEVVRVTPTGAIDAARFGRACRFVSSTA